MGPRAGFTGANAIMPVGLGTSSYTASMSPRIAYVWCRKPIPLEAFTGISATNPDVALIESSVPARQSRANPGDHVRVRRDDVLANTSRQDLEATVEVELKRRVSASAAPAS